MQNTNDITNVPNKRIFLEGPAGMSQTEPSVPPAQQDVPQELSQFNIYELNRNSTCPCGSKRKIKKCHRNILNLRHKAIEDKVAMQTQFSAHNRLLQEHGRPKMNEAQWKLYLEEKRIEEELKQKESEDV